MKPNSSRPRTISNDEISAAAYERYLRRGGEDGHDLEDWLEAEAELSSESEPSGEPTPTSDERQLRAIDDDGHIEPDAVPDVRRRERQAR